MAVAHPSVWGVSTAFLRRLLLYFYFQNVVEISAPCARDLGFRKPTNSSLCDAFSTQNELNTKLRRCRPCLFTSQCPGCIDLSASFLLKITTSCFISWLITHDQVLLSFPCEQQLFSVGFPANHGWEIHQQLVRSLFSRDQLSTPAIGSLASEGGFTLTGVNNYSLWCFWQLLYFPNT